MVNRAVIRLHLLFILLAITRASVYKDSPYIDELEPKDIYEMVRDQTEGLWVVQFYNDSAPNVEEFSTNYSVAAKSMLGYIRATSLNVQHHLFTNLAMEITEVPTYYFYNYYKHMPEQFVMLETVDDLHEETSKQLVQFFEERSVYRFVHNKYNMEMSAADLDVKLAESLAPWFVIYYKRDHPKCIEAAEIWKRLVEEFQEKIHFGSVNNPLYNIISPIDDEAGMYPIVKFYARGSKENKEPETYGGDIAYDKLFEYLDEKIPLPKVQQITNAAIATSCLKRKFCIFVFLPRLSVCAAECRLNAVTQLEEECARYKRRSWMWFWNEYNEQPDIEEAFGIAKEDGRNGTVAVLNVHAAVYMKNTLASELTQSVLESITESIKDDFGFEFHITATELPDIRKTKSWMETAQLKDEL